MIVNAIPEDEIITFNRLRWDVFTAAKRHKQPNRDDRSKQFLCWSFFLFYFYLFIFLFFYFFFFFFGASVVSYVAFVLSLFVPHFPSFGTLGGTRFVIVAFPWYLHLYVCKQYKWSYPGKTTIMKRYVSYRISRLICSISGKINI